MVYMVLSTDRRRKGSGMHLSMGNKEARGQMKFMVEI